MGTLKNLENKTILLSPNIIMGIDDNNVGNIRVYDKQGNGYVFNGMTANTLIAYFGGTEEYLLAEEMLDVLISLDNNGITQ
jgi:hypothetical protein